jgi:hypothetical protein
MKPPFFSKKLKGLDSKLRFFMKFNMEHSLRMIFQFSKYLFKDEMMSV